MSPASVYEQVLIIRSIRTDTDNAAFVEYGAWCVAVVLSLSLQREKHRAIMVLVAKQSRYHSTACVWSSRLRHWYNLCFYVHTFLCMALPFIHYPRHI